MKKLNIKGKLIWYGYGMSIYFDTDTDSYTIYDVKTKIKIEVTKMEDDKQYEIKNKTINKR